MQKWLFAKIISYLTGREGYSIDTQVFSDNDARAIVQDAFGFRYEVQVKVLGRIQGAGMGDVEIKTGTYFQVPGGLDVQTSDS